ncbi:MAG: hypothetical protein ACLT9P_10415 [Evtepia gabavorous]
MAHRRFTGLDNRLVLENLRRTAQLGPPLVVRIPVILGVNGTDETEAPVFACWDSWRRGAALELLPYHRLGRKNTASWDVRCPARPLAFLQDQLDHWRRWPRPWGVGWCPIDKEEIP